MQTRVKFQDIDWAYTKESGVWEVEQVRIRSVNLRDPMTKKASQLQVAVVNLRRPLK